MKKKELLSVTLILLAGVSTTVVGGPNASEGEMAITSAESSASGTTAVGPNGTEYEAKFSVVNRSSNPSDLGANNMTGVINSSFDGDTVNFTGIIETPTPCYTVTHSVDRSGDGQYSFTVNTEEENGTCTQVIAYHKYEASFTAEEPYQLKVSHENESVKTLTHPDYSPGNDKDTGESRGPVASFFNFLSNLFQ